MPRGTIILTPGSIILPLVAENPVFEVTIIEDGIETDVLTDVISISIDMTSRQAIWGASVKADNTDGKYTGRFSGGQILRIKADYDAGNTLQFYGTIDDDPMSVTENEGFTISWEARQVPAMVEQQVTLVFLNTTATNVIKGTTGTSDSLGNPDSGVLFESGVAWDPDNTDAPTTERIFASYQKRKRWDIIRDVCERFDYDCYIYFNESASGPHLADTYYFKMFKEGTITNTAESVVWGRNILSARNVSRPKDKVKNRIFLTGTDADDNLLLRRDDDFASQARLGIKELHIDDSSITTLTEAIDKARDLKNFHAQERLRGTLGSLGLVTLRPGEKLDVFVPFMDLNTEFVARSISHSISIDGWTCSVELEEPEVALTDFFKLAEATTLGLRPYSNFNAMTDSINLTFDQDTDLLNFIDTKTNVTINDSIAFQTSEASDGTIESITLNTVNDISEIELRISGNDDMDDSEFWVSINNGLTWILIPFPLSEPFAVPPGKHLKLKVVLKSTGDNPSPRFDTVLLLAKE